MEIAIFDLDRTITKRSTAFTAMVGLFLRGRLPLLKIFKYIHKYYISLFFSREMKREDLDKIMEVALCFLKDIKPERFERDIQSIFLKNFDKLIYSRVVSLIESERENGKTLVLATAAPLEIANIFKEKLGFHYVLSTEFQRVDGRYNGNLVDGFCHGEGKERRVKDLFTSLKASKGKIFSDSCNDLALFKFFKEGIAINPDKDLRNWCKANDIQIVFSRKFHRVRRGLRSLALIFFGYYVMIHSI